MLKLAERYAQLKGTTILSHRMDGDQIVFVLGSGGKFSFSKLELERQVLLLESASPKVAPETMEKVDAMDKPKNKRKESS